MKKSLNIVFAGTPAFGLPCLEALADSPHQLKAVYTQPDRPAGRGRQLQASAVKSWALNHDVPVFQPANFKSQAALDELQALQPDVMIVIAYGLILPKAVLNIPTLGCINVHASLLPRWRGASPIQHALLHGDTETGVTIMQMDTGMDTGAMLAKETCVIQHNETTHTLHDRLAQLAVAPLLTVINQLAEKSTIPKVQDGEHATYASKIKKEDALIDWHQPAHLIDCKIRAFYPWPVAFTHLKDERLRILKARALTETCSKEPGTIIAIDKTGITVATGDALILIEQLQFPGKKAMSVCDWLNAGNRQLQCGTVLA